MTIDIEEGVRLRITRHFPASPERVFRAFVDPAEVARWMWAGLGRNPSAEIDLRVGGRYRIAIDPKEGDVGWNGGDLAMSGVYVEIDPSRRLVYTLHWEANVEYNTSGAEVLDEAVVVDFAKDGEGTKVVFQHIGIPNDGVSAAGHGDGMNAAFNLLEQMVSG